MPIIQFTALIRLPFIRGDFEDPPQASHVGLHFPEPADHHQAQWDAEKDRQLWKVISKSSKTSDLNCKYITTTFNITH
jgi:hypothetical protein